MRRFFRENGLSIVLFALFFVFLLGQILTGHARFVAEQEQHHEPPITLVEYLESGDFIEVTTENWESEFLQMFVYVTVTIFLYQKGSSESKDPLQREEVDREPDPHRKGAPWPVRRGGLALALYQHSLALTFLALFLGSMALHAVGGHLAYNDEQRTHGGTPISLTSFLGKSEFWFQSFQNWQSEFLAIGTMVLFSVFLRQRGSPESKPVDAAWDETGN